jgi:hypothetical protein
VWFAKEATAAFCLAAFSRGGDTPLPMHLPPDGELSRAAQRLCKNVKKQRQVLVDYEISWFDASVLFPYPAPQC